MNTLIVHAVVYLLYFVPFYLFFSDLKSWLFFMAGGVLGFGLLFADRVFHALWVDHKSEVSKHVQDLVRRRKFVDSLKLVYLARKYQERLTTRSVAFLLAYVPLSIFVLTSTGSIIGSAMVLGIGLHTVLDMFRYFGDKGRFRKHFLWQLNKRLEEKEMKILLAAVTGFFTLLTMMFVWG